jgi:hypothetical protein
MIGIYGSFMVLEKIGILKFGVWTLELGRKWKFGTIWWKVGAGLELI